MPERQPMINASLFKNDRKETDAQPDFTGPGTVTADSLQAIYDAVQRGEMQLDDRGAIKIRVAGWKKVSQGGKSYISLAIQLDRPRPAESSPVAAAPAGDDLF